VSVDLVSRPARGKHDRLLLVLCAIALVLSLALAASVIDDHRGTTPGNLHPADQAIDQYYQENGALRERLTPDDILAYARENGGFTYNPLYGATPKHGYAVSLKDHGEAFEIGTVTSGDLQKYMQENEGKMINPAQYIGGWVNDGKLYLNISIVLGDEKEARKTVWINGGTNTYNLGTNETIYLKDQEGNWLIDAYGNWLPGSG
jgi:hypothetical protein